jgi:5-methyltetrahydrofolate--homocysteine methyltransferase
LAEIPNGVAEAVIEGNVGVMVALTEAALDQSVMAQEILDDGLMVGVNHVGKEFKASNTFVREVLRSAKAVKDSMKLLAPMSAAGEAQAAGRLLIGTVKGSLHDIGKNLVGVMCEGAGFEVMDLGTGVEPDQFLEAIKGFEFHIVGMSALPTTTMRSTGDTVRALSRRAARSGEDHRRRRPGHATIR